MGEPAIQTETGNDVQHFVVDNPFWKARPATEGDELFLFFEPSNENRDEALDKVEEQALAKAAPGYLALGNVDLNHYTLRPPEGMSHEEARMYELGYPVSVRTESPILVKAKIHRGEGKRFEKVNIFREDVIGGRRFYPSIAGNYRAGGRVCDGQLCVVKALEWVSTAMAAPPFLPVNRTVKAAALSMDAFVKAVLAGSYETDSARLTGSDALRHESMGRVVEVQQLVDNAAIDAAISEYLNALVSHGGGCDHVDDGAVSLAELREHFEDCADLSAASARIAAASLRSMIASHASSEMAAAA